MNQNFNIMAKELGSIETLRNDFVVNVSHEFKTPISTIEGYATLLSNSLINDEQKNIYLSKILNSTKRLSTLTSNILLLSKLENQEIIINKINFSLDEQIRTTILSLESEWSTKKIVFNLDLPNTIIFANEELLFQVWYNIIHNAIKFSHTNSKINIAINNANENTIITIEDFGCGISSNALSHIFEKFFQEDNSRNQNGNGLGLSLVHKILSLCNGSINVSSVLGEGTKFIIKL